MNTPSSRLLIDEYPLLVSPSLAAQIGLNEAIIIQQIHFWLDNPKSGIQHEGKRWIWNSYSEWEAQFPFWSESTIKRIVKSCKASGVLLVERLRRKQGDQTNYFSIDYARLDELLKPRSGGEGQSDTTPNGLCQNDTMQKVRLTRRGCQSDPMGEGQIDTLYNEHRPPENSSETSLPQTPTVEPAKTIASKMGGREEGGFATQGKQQEKPAVKTKTVPPPQNQIDADKPPELEAANSPKFHWPEAMSEAEQQQAKPILERYSLPVDQQQQVLDAWAWKIHQGGIKSRMGILGYLCQQTSKGELDTSLCDQGRALLAEKAKAQQREQHAQLRELDAELRGATQLANASGGADWITQKLSALQAQWQSLTGQEWVCG